MAKIGLDSIDPATPVSQLGIGQQQMVEIARNLQDDTRILVLDEPTAMATPHETNYLFEQIAHLTARGVATSTCRASFWPKLDAGSNARAAL